MISTQNSNEFEKHKLKEYKIQMNAILMKRKVQSAKEMIYKMHNESSG